MKTPLELLLRGVATIACTLALLVAPIAPAAAGQNCEARRPSVESMKKDLALAASVALQLDELAAKEGARVLVIARAGQNLAEYGLRWSHLGIAYRDESALDGRGAWRVVHKLNHCGSAHAAVYRQGLGEFFLDDLHLYEAGIVVPTADVQQRLLPLLQDNARVAQLHVPAYNMVAYPWAQRYQQSNQWAIETLALAMEPGAASRDRAQAWLQFKGYQPSVLRVGALTRLGARMTAAHIAFDDHPNDKRFADRIETVSADSVFRWLGRSGLGGDVITVR
jgi:hypothetical protein